VLPDDERRRRFLDVFDSVARTAAVECVDAVERLAAIRDQGLLDASEFQAQKRKVLDHQGS